MIPFDTMEKLVRSTRSYRRFDGSHALTTDTLASLVNLARQSASAANLQPLKYILSADAGVNAEIYDCLAWAAYLKEWKGPESHERPTGYVVMLGDTTVAKNFHCDHGIAAQTLLLGAVSQGLGGCMFAAINHKRLRKALDIAGHLEILLVIALGRPVEEVVIDPVSENGSIRYWRDDDRVHHVPKRDLNDIIVAVH